MKPIRTMLSRNFKIILSIALSIILVASGLAVGFASNKIGNPLGTSGRDANLLTDIPEGNIILGESEQGETPDESPNVILGASMAPFAAGDLVVTMKAALEAYPTYTNVATGKVPPELAFNLGIQVGAINGNDKIEIEATHLTGVLGTAFFKYRSHSAIKPDDPVIDTIVVTGEKIVVNIKANASPNSVSSVILYYDFNLDYDGQVYHQTPLMTQNYSVFSGSAIIPIGSGSIDVKAESGAAVGRVLGNQSGMIPTPVSLGSGNYTANYVAGETVSPGSLYLINDLYYKNAFDPADPPRLDIYLPVGATATNATLGGVIGNTFDTSVTIADGDVPDVPAGTYAVKRVTVSATPTDWQYHQYGGDRSRSFITTAGLSMTIPSKAVGEFTDVYYKYSWTSVGSTQREYDSFKMKYNFVAPPDWNFRPTGAHSTGDATPVRLPHVSALPGKFSAPSIYTMGFGYSNAGSMVNKGYGPVKNTQYVLDFSPNSLNTPSYANLHPHTVTLAVERETASFPWGQYQYEVMIRQTNGVERTSKAGTIVPNAAGTSYIAALDLPAQSALGSGEYVSRVIITPYSSDGLVKGDYVAKSSLRVVYQTASWDSGTYPGGQTIIQGGYHLSKIHPQWSFTYLDGPSSTMKTVDGNKYETTHSLNVQNPRGQFVSSDPTVGSVEPGDKVQFTFRGITPGRSSTPWENVSVVIRIPEGGEITSQDMPLYNDTGAPIGTVHVGAPQIIDGDIVQKLDLNTAAAFVTKDKGMFSFPFTITTLSTTPQGTYELKAALTNHDPTTYHGYVENEDHGGNTPAFFGLSADSNFTYHNLPGYPNTSYKIIDSTGSRSSSEIKSSVSNWSSDPMVAADRGDTVEVKLTVTNNGNTRLKDFMLFDILPRAGLHSSTGSLELLSIEPVKKPGDADPIIYYHYGALGETDYMRIREFNPASNSEWGTSPAGATAFFVDFGTTSRGGSETLEVVLKFKVPAGQDQTVYNKFSYAYTDSTGDKREFPNPIQGFTTESYYIDYQANSTDPTGADVSNLPPHDTGIFDIPTPGQNSLLVTSAQPTRTHYEFVRWNTAANGSGTTYTAGDTKSFTLAGRSLVLYAQWVLTEYAVTFNANTGVGADVVVGNVTALTSLTAAQVPTTFTKLHYVQAGWTTDAAGTTAFDPTTAPITKNLTLYAKWVRNVFTITYDGNGVGSSVATPTPAQTDIIVGGTIPTFPTATRPTYDFQYWSTAPAGGVGTEVIAGTGGTPIVGDTRLYAIWALANYTITYDVNPTNIVGGTTNLVPGNPGTETRTHGQALTFPNPSFIGYDFGGWEDAQGNLYAGGASHTVTGPLALSAQWRAIDYAVKFYENITATNLLFDETRNYDGVVTPLPTPPASTSLTFEYWYTLNSSGGEVLFDATTQIRSDVTVYGKWSNNQYLVQFFTQSTAGGTWEEITTEQTTVTHGDPVTPPVTAPTPPTGYRFAGWSKNEHSASGDWTGTAVVTQSFRVYAIFVKQIYTVTFDYQGGTGSVASSQTAYDTGLGIAKMPSNNLLHGYIFTGWNTAANGSGTAFTEATRVMQNITVFAQWELGDHQVTVRHMRYGHNETAAQAVLFETELVAAKHLSNYTIAPKNYPHYVFQAGDTGPLTVQITDATTLDVYYKAERLALPSGLKTDIEVEVNDRYPSKDNRLPLENFTAKVGFASNKARNQSAITAITSANYSGLSYHAITSGYDQMVTLTVAFVTGQTETLDVNVRVVDITNPVITVIEPVIQYNIFGSGLTEKELNDYLQYFAKATDNYDGDISYRVVYPKGASFDEMRWVVGEYGLILRATDSSGNTADDKGIVVSIIDRDPNRDNEGSSTPDGIPERNREILLGKNPPENDTASQSTLDVLGNEEQQADKGGKLPNTGGFPIFVLILPALLLVVLGIILLKRKKEDPEENIL